MFFDSVESIDVCLECFNKAKNLLINQVNLKEKEQNDRN